MAHTPHEPDLLEHLAKLAGCIYLSDLHTPMCRDRLHHALQQTPAQAYPDEAWQEAACYILGRAARGDGATQRALLLETTGGAGS